MSNEDKRSVAHPMHGIRRLTKETIFSNLESIKEESRDYMVEKKQSKHDDHGEITYNKEDVLFRPRLNVAYKKNNLIHLRTNLEKDFKAADIRWSLFISACLSHKVDKVLNPFPPTFIQRNNLRDIEALQYIAEGSPPLSILRHEIHDPDNCQVNECIIRLLNWMFLTMKYPQLITLDKECFKPVLNKVQSKSPVPLPDQIFKVVDAADSAYERRWRELCNTFSTNFVYHSAMVENFHSVLHLGLQKRFDKYMRCQEKSGICLTKEISKAHTYSPSGYAWNNAKNCGTKMSCVALCEVVDLDGLIEVSNSSERIGSNARNPKKNVDVDERLIKSHYVVTDDEMVRVRYLLVYIKPQYEKAVVPKIFEWCKDHKLLTGMFFYVILVGCILLNYFSH